MSPLPAIIHVTSWLSRQGGGIPPVIEALGRELLKRRVECRVAGLADNSSSEVIFPDQNGVTRGKVFGPTAFGYSPELKAALASRVTNPSVIHVHGLWMYPGLLARQLSCRNGVSLVISPHGMLEPWALQNSRWKKRIARLLFENRNLRAASCLHALCPAEADNFRGLGLRNPVAVIPNGVDMSDFQDLPGRGVLEARFPVLRGHRWILFLSRIHPKKGLPHLLRAWATLQKTEHGRPKTAEWVLAIAGWDEGEHEAEMKGLTAELGLGQHVCFTGPLHGQEKLAALAGAELFVLPSFSEGFSMAVLEAAAAGSPVLLTPQCNFPELAKAGAAIEVAPEVAGCEAGLREMLCLSDAERRAMGQRGKGLVARSYTWGFIADQMLGVYHWLLKGGSPPECVRVE